jgi:radical SAM superfamily enzyme YgiQ (UPF0313 family)
MEQHILFVEPMGTTANVFAKYMTIPLLGPVYLATIASRAGFSVQVINENILGRHISPDELLAADVLCLSCITATVERGKLISRLYRRLRKAAGLPGRTLIGGIHASMLPEDVAADFDQVVVGEAEGIILDLLSGKTKEKVVHGSQLEDLDSLPLPDFTLVKEHQKIKITPAITSRGCPFHCNFCSVTEMFGRGYRAMSPERVMREVSRYTKGSLFFADDNFAEQPGRTNAILDLMLDQGFKRPWSTQVRTNLTKRPDLVAKMKKAGCTTVYVGLESVNPQALLDMHKGQTVADIQRSIKVFHEHGILVHGMFILGNDADTPEVLKTTADFCQSSGLDYVQYMILTPLPGTQVYQAMEREGRLLHKNWDYYDAMHAVFKPKRMSPEALQRGMVECFGDFYSYTNAANEALNAVFSTAGTLVKRLYSNAHFPSYYPAMVRLVGRGILRNWIRDNRGYMKYLSTGVKAPEPAGGLG